MISSAQFFGFLLAAVLITLAPGPDNLMVLGMGMSRGRRQGMAFGLGCAFGCLSHTTLAVLGVSALIAASPPAFTALRVGGGAYLLWLGWGALRSRGATAVRAGGDAERGASMLKLFFRGVFANAINPKVVLFFLSFLPQFVDARRGHVAWQLAALGVTFTLQAALLFGLIGAFSGVIGEQLKRRPRLGVWLDRVAGTVFVGLGLKLIVAR
ncbi:threonine efflux protein [mine drainage metagenome]|jgi:threonine/homoserine/homoserine lactone efflux protein|uniref:Threonine efflux protein n=1 Tax=mine drainage metagenome TaxID=410659 RepID=A0A1J5RWN2_9ZZZZ